MDIGQVVEAGQQNVEAWALSCFSDCTRTAYDEWWGGLLAEIADKPDLRTANGLFLGVF